MADFYNEIQFQMEPLKELAFGSLTSSYVAIGTPLVNPSRIMYIKNSSNVDVYISTDGTNAIKHMVAAGTDIINCRANYGCWPAGTQFYAKIVTGTATSGYIVIESVYANKVANP
jgi:hypothetical protein